MNSGCMYGALSIPERRIRMPEHWAKPRYDKRMSGVMSATPPEGRARWTLELLAGELVKLTAHDNLSRETVRRRLAENDLKPWRKEMWCIPHVDAEYVARMEDVLDLYAEASDPTHPVVCFDESPTQLIGEVRQPIPAEPGQIERYDCEYKRSGTANLFIFLDVHRPWRKVKVSDSRSRTWSKSKSVCCAANAWTGASPATSISYLRSAPGNDSAMLQEPASNGCSQPLKPAQKWAALTPNPLPSASPKSKKS